MGSNTAPPAAEQRRSTGIEWTSHTWNPIIGCSMRSAGCRNCYAMAMAARLDGMGNANYRGLTKTVDGRPVWTGTVRRNSATAVAKPDGIRTPSLIFVNSMSDVFHDNVTDEMRLEIWTVMVRNPRHTFQVLTKRPENIAPFFARTSLPTLRNVWLGATVEDDRVRDRVAIMRDVPAAVRFLSVEPLIGALTVTPAELAGIGWVITGGESGPGARACDVRWLRMIRDRCLTAGVPHFFKQWGRPENNPIYTFAREQGKSHRDALDVVEKRDPVGKGGSLLDGQSWKQFPAGARVAAY